jgi:hypothetical protein
VRTKKSILNATSRQSNIQWLYNRLNPSQRESVSGFYEGMSTRDISGLRLYHEQREQGEAKAKAQRLDGITPVVLANRIAAISRELTQIEDRSRKLAVEAGEIGLLISELAIGNQS